MIFKLKKQNTVFQLRIFYPFGTDVDHRALNSVRQGALVFAEAGRAFTAFFKLGCMKMISENVDFDRAKTVFLLLVALVVLTALAAFILVYALNLFVGGFLD